MKRRHARPHLALLAGVSAAVAAAIVLSVGTGSGTRREQPAPGALVAAGVRSGALALTADGAPVVAYVRGRTLYLARRDGKTWKSDPAVRMAPAAAYRVQLVLDRGDRPTVLVQDLAGRWLGVAARTASGWSWRVLARAQAPSRGLGPAGLTLDGKLEPVIASASAGSRQASRLRLIRLRGSTVSSTSITRDGFPRSLDAPAAMPVLLPGRRLHVVEAFGAPHSVQGVEWGRESDGWWGQILQAGVFDRASGSVRALVDTRGTLWSAWTAVGFAQTLVVLASRHGTVEQSTVYPNASLAALALGPSGPELAVNEAGSARILQAGRARVRIAGSIADFAVDTKGRRYVLVGRGGSLYYLLAPLGRRLPAASRIGV